MNYYSESIQTLIEELSGLPNIGPKSAQRLAFHILNLPEKRVEHLANSILNARKKICFCKECFNLSDHELCQICSDEKRDKLPTAAIRTRLTLKRLWKIPSATSFS